MTTIRVLYRFGSMAMLPLAAALVLCPWKKAAAEDWADDLKSPLATDAKWILAGGAGLTIAVIATQDSVSGPFETWTAKHQPLGRYSKYGDMMGQMVPNALYAGGMWAASRFGFSESGERALMMAESTLYASLIGTALKSVIGEGRPYNSETASSFPSGHSLTAFAFAGLVAAEHGWYYGVPAMLLAGFVGYSRINDNQHRAHDVVAGATIGLSVAYGIHLAHRSRHPMPSVLPAAIPGGVRLVAQWTL